MRSRLGWHGRLALAFAVPAAVMVAAPAHAATTVRLDSGTTRLTLDGRTSRALRAAGIDVRARRPATRRGRTVTLPVRGGAIDPATAKGTIAHRGSITLRRGRARVTLRNLVIDTRRGRLLGKVGRRTITIGAARGGTVARRGVATDVAGVTVRLGRAGARTLNRTFGARTVRRGMPTGRATVRTDPAEVAVRSGATTLTLDRQVVAGLGQLRVTVGPIAPATADATTGAITFPATGGTLTVRDLHGTVDHRGGVSLTQQGGSPFELTEPTVTLGRSPQLAVRFAGTAVPIGAIDPADVRATLDPDARTVEVAGATLRLTPVAADALNSFFVPAGGRPAFPAGLVLGTVAASLQLR